MQLTRRCIYLHVYTVSSLLALAGGSIMVNKRLLGAVLINAFESAFYFIRVDTLSRLVLRNGRFDGPPNDG